MLILSVGGNGIDLDVIGYPILSFSIIPRYAPLCTRYNLRTSYHIACHKIYTCNHGYPRQDPMNFSDPVPSSGYGGTVTPSDQHNAVIEDEPVLSEYPSVVIAPCRACSTKHPPRPDHNYICKLFIFASAGMPIKFAPGTLAELSMVS